ncbi:YjdF family protein [Tsukamurella sp. 8F]|uniref:YjdF family protein n=1 Tax=unclassified Tsukamurella TaxID=2633480 RepID=UPI0023BA27D1|nr:MULTISPECIES: YjdF family protein [unclassified Tsukamurella]MDF0529975.1 YjdF family protein [Tsukamurella sp. 8J]MDF0587253.1 YjdF family protein [Tsukamurella sp. 8F]
MDSDTFTVYFDGQFWVGLLEVTHDGELRTARHVFGSEPTAPELYEFALHEYGRLSAVAHCSPPVDAGGAERPRRPNPKRLARQVAKETGRPPVSTAAQEAMRLAIESGATARKRESKIRREADGARRRELARAKAKARHRGRA